MFTPDRATPPAIRQQHEIYFLHPVDRSRKPKGTNRIYTLDDAGAVASAPLWYGIDRYMSSPIEFFFDYISPYAYLAWTRIHDLAARHGREVRPTPVLFAGLLNASGQLGPAEIPSKRLYVFKDTLRTANLLGVPLRAPPTHPYNPLLSLRVTHAEAGAPHLKRLIDRMFHAAWGSGAGVETAEQVSAVLNELGLDAAGVIARAHSAEVKQRLRDSTDRAIAAGAFGVPTMLADGELFWGYDSLGHLDRYLAGQESLDPALVQEWARIAATADRRRRESASPVGRDRP